MRKLPRVGIGVLIFKGGKVLLGKRYAALGKNTWAPPGGHLEFNETAKQGAIREVQEESGLTLKKVEFITITEEFYKKENKHYVTLWFQAKIKSGTPVIREPDNIGAWKWFDWKKLPKPLYITVKNLLKSGYKPRV